MKNIPRIFIGDNITSGATVPVAGDVAHYLGHVMRCRQCLAFGGGREFYATLSDDGRHLVIGESTGRADPSGNITLFFAPIKRTDDLINMATQMGIAHFVPVITEHTTAQHVNWGRMQKIMIEAAEQSNRNSVPTIAQPVKFADLDLSDMVFADERTAYRENGAPTHATGKTKILIGPEGGFSDSEFKMLDSAGSYGITLGRTILRAEVAAIIAIDRILS